MENLRPRNNKSILTFLIFITLSLSVSCQSKKNIYVVVDNNVNEFILLKHVRNHKGSASDTVFLNSENMGCAIGINEDEFLNANFKVLLRESNGKLRPLNVFSLNKSTNKNEIYYSNGFTVTSGNKLVIIMAVGNSKYLKEIMNDDKFIQSKTFEDKLDRAFILNK